MFEDLNLVDRLHRDMASVRWAEPEEIRARARRRSQRTAVLAAAAALAVLSGSAYATARPPAAPAPPIAANPTSTVSSTSIPTPTPTAIPTSTPSPTGPSAEIPRQTLLTARDVPVKTGARLSESGLRETVRVDPVLETCGRERGLPLTEADSRYSVSQTLMRPTGDRTPAPGLALTQDVYRVDPERSRLLVNTLPLLVETCGEWQQTGSLLVGDRTVPTVTTHRWETPMTGFAGDDSVMLRHVSLGAADPASGKALAPPPPIEVTMVVRVGDLVTVIATGPDTLEDTLDGARGGDVLSYPDLRALGRTAAHRMCAAAKRNC